MGATITVSHLVCVNCSCLVDEDGWAECGERACPTCGSPAVSVTELVGGLEWGRCECGFEWDT